MGQAAPERLFHPGDRVAVTGAISLLAIETAPAGGEEE